MMAAEPIAIFIPALYACSKKRASRAAIRDEAYIMIGFIFSF